MVLVVGMRSFGRCPFFAQSSTLFRGKAKCLTTPKWKRICVTAGLPKQEKDAVSVTFVSRDGQSHSVCGKEGDTLLDMYNNNGLDFPGYGNCGGTMSCSTCLVILPDEYYEKSLNPDMAAENDMIDLSGSLHMTSRLGCQVKMTKALDGMVVTIPPKVKDIREVTLL